MSGPADNNRVWTLARRPSGTPTDDCFAFESRPTPEPDPGEALVRTRVLSVDPYMRGRMRAGESYAEPWDVGAPLEGGVVGEVVTSNGTPFDDGDLVVGTLQWADYATAPAHALTPVDVGDLPASTALGVLGMPGRTAYFGTREVAEPRPGDTVVVSAAAGAVGSVAGQLASMAGARVVGTAGSERKLEWLHEIGFDAAVNYRAVDDYDAALAEAAPDGVDVYFDNVGGPLTDAVFDRLNVDARVAVCGQIALYNAEERPVGPRKLGSLIASRARVEGFLVSDFAPRFETATADLRRWVEAGEIDYRETVTDGLENAPDAFRGLFEGENVGKQVVRVADDYS
jgi:NADPH-dependent curcumin reductase CurA